MGACFNSQCTGCVLHSMCRTTCIQAVWYGQEDRWPEAQEDRVHSRVLYVIGEAPGYQEDQEGRPWIGKAGNILKSLYLDYFKIGDEVDIFLSNSIRCRPPGNKTPNKTQLKACQGYYLADIIQLQKIYDQVVILCCGAPAVKSVLSMSLKKSFSRQGDTSDFRALTAPTPKSIIPIGEIVGPYLDDPTFPPFPRPCPVFTTYHPAAVGRDKNKGLLIAPHMSMLRDFLKGQLEYEIKGGHLNVQMAPKVPAYPLKVLSLDIETYGILKGQTQKMWHPLKSVVHDLIPRERLCVTTGLTWLNEKDEQEHGIFLMDNEVHRRRLWSWIRNVHQRSVDPSSTSYSTVVPSQTISEKDTSWTTSNHTSDKSSCPTENYVQFQYLIGQNIKFDIMYLRYAYPEIKQWLTYPIPLCDLIVTNYLYNESRPERSLKALAPLLRVTKYPMGFTQYSKATSTSLHQYNCQDTAATLLSHMRLETLISKLYGSDTPKISPWNRQWYTKVLWLTIWMEENGIAMNEGALKGLMKSYTARLARLERGIETRWNLNLRGKGSEKNKRSIMDGACSTLLKLNIGVPPLDKTDARQEISFKEKNRNVLLDVLPASETSYRQLRAIGRVQTVTGILDRYLYPLLVGRGKGHMDPTTCLIQGICYPRWYPVPSEFEDGKDGGTKQCRIIAKGPAVQTFPPRIKACIESRYGCLIWFDYSQIELRIAALLSNDPWLSEKYRDPMCDLHLHVSEGLFGKASAKRFRQIGKTLNFLTMFGGGAGQYQMTLMRDEGIARSRGQCQKDIDEWWKLVPRLKEWQGELFKSVCDKKYLQLPLAGQSRLFMGNKSDIQEHVNEIVNTPVQGEAANVTLSAQFELQWAFKQKGMRAIVPLNVYDGGTIEFPKTEIYAVQREMTRILPNPPYYQALCNVLGRTLPLKYKVSKPKLRGV